MWFSWATAPSQPLDPILQSSSETEGASALISVFASLVDPLRRFILCLTVVLALDENVGLSVVSVVDAELVDGAGEWPRAGGRLALERRLDAGVVEVDCGKIFTSGWIGLEPKNRSSSVMYMLTSPNCSLHLARAFSRSCFCWLRPARRLRMLSGSLVNASRSCLFSRAILLTFCGLKMSSNWWIRQLCIARLMILLIKLRSVFWGNVSWRSQIPNKL